MKKKNSKSCKLKDIKHQTIFNISPKIINSELLHVQVSLSGSCFKEIYSHMAFVKKCPKCLIREGVVRYNKILFYYLYQRENLESGYCFIEQNYPNSSRETNR